MAETMGSPAARLRYGQSSPEHRRASRSRDRVLDRLAVMRNTRATVLRVQISRAEQLLLDLADASAIEGRTYRVTRFLCQLDARRRPPDLASDPIEAHQDHAAADALENSAREDALLLRTPAAQARHLRALYAEIDAKVQAARRLSTALEGVDR